MLANRGGKRIEPVRDTTGFEEDLLFVTVEIEPLVHRRPHLAAGLLEFPGRLQRHAHAVRFRSSVFVSPKSSLSTQHSDRVPTPRPAPRHGRAASGSQR